jgi:hypothetical protein
LAWEAAHFDPELLVPASPLDPLEFWNEILYWVPTEIDPPDLNTLTLDLLQIHQEAWLSNGSTFGSGGFRIDGRTAANDRIPSAPTQYSRSGHLFRRLLSRLRIRPG